MKKIIEIQSKIDKQRVDIAAHSDLLVVQESDSIDFDKMLEVLTLQRNDLLIAEKFGHDNKAAIAETDKNIKATKAAIEKQKERVSLLKSVTQKIDAKNDLLSKLSDNHQAAIIEHLSEMVAEKTVERNEIYSAYVEMVKDIAAVEAVMSSYQQTPIGGTENNGHVGRLWQQAGGIFSDNSFSESVQIIASQHRANLIKAGVNL